MEYCSNRKNRSVGLHLTLASGLPIIKKRGGLSTEEIWGNFIEWASFTDRNGESQSDFVFRDYTDFYLQYELLPSPKRLRIEQTIIDEFEAQKSRLEIALADAASKNPNKPNALKFTSVSNHFDFFTLTDNFLHLYKEVAGNNLAIRSPRRIMLLKSKAYVIVLGKKGVGTKNQIETAKHHVALFDKYQYSKPLSLKTSSYLDIGLYASFGGLNQLPVFSSYANRRKKLLRMVDRSLENRVWRGHPDVPKTVEIVFHLGYSSAVAPIFSELDGQGYVKINYKYFDNRIIEDRVLNSVSKNSKFQDTVLQNLTSWENSPTINFTTP